MRRALTRTAAALAILLGLGDAGLQAFAEKARQQPPELSATEL